ncbi:VOC family protein [Dyadobacter arcticus]|uniref:PhnB protein n=1 Tax=Dyadobacter arcticus TaxID=1078754 RepID=A0ABX0UIH9_9BACT|nr:VOC family protein [Dyadobacter arcticus]NIJ52818.1 PhnB protein [Dyadobacter arcticus]
MSKNPTFAPQLWIPNGVTNVDFYINAFAAVELRRFSNEDGSIHVSELSIEGAIFHLHEETHNSASFSPARYQGTTVTIGIFVPDVDAVMASAIAAGAELLSPAQDYDYGYRQGEVKDPFGHIWMVDAVI